MTELPRQLMTDIEEACRRAGVSFWPRPVRSAPVQEEEGFVFLDEPDLKTRFWTERFAAQVEAGHAVCAGVLPIGDAGFGAFAVEDIPAGSMIGEYAGEILDANGLDERKGYYFSFPVTPPNLMWKMFICAQAGGNITRFINHSWDPNVSHVRVDTEQSAHVVYKADRDIRRGDQLLIDYGIGYWADADVAPRELPRRIEAFM